MVAVVVLVVAASKTIFDMTFFNISFHPFGHLYIYFLDFHSFGGGVGAVVAAVVMVVVAAVAVVGAAVAEMVLVVVSLGMILCLKIVRF